METFDNSPEASSPVSISSAEDIPASPSAKPVSAAAPTIQGIFGQSSRASFAYFDRDSCSWKTYQATFLSGLEMFSETWPDSGSMRSGRVFGRVTAELPTCESGSSSWPTPTQSDGTGGPRKTPRMDKPADSGPDDLRSAIGGQLNPTWVEWLMGFPLGWTDLGDSATPSSPRLLSGSGEG